ncbi:MAG: 5'-nucleotidase SurE [Owenweeksia sp. TMED14]|nr:MAG: 5'-nucleotidase SurE [Owenweeksia sp. TMED14]
MTKMVKPLILITNDDGISSPGIRMLINQMNSLGDVVVVAPNSPQSGMGHAITINDSLRCDIISIDSGSQKEYSCSGTPVDCIKLGVHEILDRKPDLIVSGVNHGSNASVNVIYSGTMAAAIEGSMQGVPSIGFSLLDYSWEADFTEAEEYVLEIASKVLKNGLPNGICLNVNIPKMSNKKCNGIKICRQTIGKWIEDFDKRIDPNGKSYYWMTGAFKDQDGSDQSDIWALNEKYVSIVPVKFDLTAHESLIDITKILGL